MRGRGGSFGISVGRFTPTEAQFALDEAQLALGKEFCPCESYFALSEG
jgi:hypothetical protein